MILPEESNKRNCRRHSDWSAFDSLKRRFFGIVFFNEAFLRNMKQPSAIGIATLIKCVSRHMKRFASFIRKANKHHGSTAAASFLPQGKYFISFAVRRCVNFNFNM